MLITVPMEPRAGERLVAATPRTVAALVRLGYDVAVQSGAGAAANLPDEAYVAAGARICDRADAWSGDVVTAVNAPGEDELALMKKGAILVASLAPHSQADRLPTYAAHGITALSLDAVPRISRAQSLDVLSSMSNVAGYRAVIEAAEAYGGMFAGQVTAAGKTPPATVFVIGGGVAGLAAIGAAVSLGAQVRAFDVRPEAAEQIESMGATFVSLPAAQQEVSSDGYASELTEAQERLTQELYAAEAAGADVIITTALVRGQAPTTITADAVAGMRAGSVIVDLAASGGGNCELTVPGDRVVTEGGVTIVGWTDLPGRMPQHSSQLLGTNIVNLLALLTPAKDGSPVLDLDDVVLRGMTVAHDGDVLWPPPPIQVSARPAAAPAVENAGAVPAEPAPASAARTPASSTTRRTWLMGIGAGALAIALAFSSAAFLAMFTVFVLSVVIGYYVISNVSHSLHTPLMSQTNAISGIILVGALLQLGSSNTVVTVLAFVAAAVASINVFGGFLVTYRMLGMFQKGA
ncbi:Re/Si-specific NAD(P)(+) transhydrogenase subunit alpha [Demequina muriae]|uniref:proton-translocating NAD(P)(+) transhydrogenase n=1 Tax=Demequina muriae TaxID=3051664 RepID=A0ABT8GG00_9MICO|nr:Re/Si-specific NAD(P)(+) transhydrogenase subunit alpha [Demequina sp. EGI L300058]MDN4480360.1 Re/Si-specific NAD(P)(+) transhydrogenase subunit alpha [Demequina sp. EGI L300058]